MNLHEIEQPMVGGKNWVDMGGWLTDFMRTPPTLNVRPEPTAVITVEDVYRQVAAWRGHDNYDMRLAVMNRIRDFRFRTQEAGIPYDGITMEVSGLEWRELLQYYIPQYGVDDRLDPPYAMIYGVKVIPARW